MQKYGVRGKKKVLTFSSDADNAKVIALKGGDRKVANAVNDGIRIVLDRNECYRTFRFPSLNVILFEDEFVVLTGDNFGSFRVDFESFEEGEEFENLEDFKEYLAGFEKQVAKLLGYWPERRV